MESYKNENMLYNHYVFMQLLDEWKKATGRSQDYFADVLGISRQSVAAYKRGVIPRDDVLSKMCEVFRVEKSVFFTPKSAERLKYEIEHKRFLTWKNGIKALYVKMGMIQIIDDKMLFIDSSGIENPIDKSTFENMLYSLYDMSENLFNLCIVPDSDKKPHRLSMNPKDAFPIDPTDYFIPDDEFVYKAVLEYIENHPDDIHPGI